MTLPEMEALTTTFIQQHLGDDGVAEFKRMLAVVVRLEEARNPEPPTIEAHFEGVPVSRCSAEQLTRLDQMIRDGLISPPPGHWGKRVYCASQMDWTV